MKPQAGRTATPALAGTLAAAGATDGMRQAAQTCPESASLLSRAIKFYYGIGAVAYGVNHAALGSLVLLFFNQVIGLPAQWVGMAIMIAMFFDAIFDPLLGRWSDHVRSQWGRRHPFMYASAIPIAVAFYWLWHPPHGWPNHAMFFYMLAMLMAVRLLTSIYEIPSAALAPELTLDYDERTQLLSHRFFYGMLGGGAMAVLAFRVFLRQDATHPLGVLNRRGYEQYGLVAAIVMLIAILVSAVGTQGKSVVDLKPVRRGESLAERLKDVREILSNRSFLSLMSAAIIFSVGNGLATSLGLYIATYFWELTSQQISYLIVFGGIAAVLGVTLAAPISKRMGKKRAMITLFCCALVTGVIPIPLRLIGLMPANHTTALLAALLVDGLVRDTLAIMGFIIAASMMSDIVEDVAVKTGQRSEGLLFAANGLVLKSVSGIGTFLSGLLLEAVAFPQGAKPGLVDPLVLRHLALLFVPVTAGCAALAIVALTFYRIDRKTHLHNLEKLRDAAAAAERAGVETAEDLTAIARID
ncbi:MAG: MFS transporter [Candidatus Binataceae bacterium]